MLDQRVVQDVFALLDPEVWLVTSRDGPKRGGLTATLVGQASIVPDHPRVIIGLSPQHFTTTVIRVRGGFALHLLDDSHRDLAWRFGTLSGHDGDKFQDDVWAHSPQGHPRLTNAVAWLECSVEQTIESGDRLYFLARVDAAEVTTGGPILRMRDFMSQLTPGQLREAEARLRRDAVVDANLIRQFQYLNSPLAGLSR